jgi:hypothetical protein
MRKTPYAGNELRIDGYYYSNPYNENSICVAVLYRDGFCIHTRITPDQDTLNHIENQILLNVALIDKLKNAPSHIGVFRIMYPDIVIEAWEYRNTTFSHYGEIVNDTTFIVRKQINNRTNDVYTQKLIYKFKQFSPKPDSANRYVR